MTAFTQELVDSLRTLNEIADTLNRSLNAQEALDSALAQLVELMGLETGWIFLKDETARSQWHGRGYLLAAHCNLPPAMAPHKASAWKGGCDCQAICSKERLTEAYNEVRCSRLAETKREDRAGLAVHASAPLRSGDRLLGILNVAAPDWDSFTPEALALLTNVGSQMGIALERARLFDLLQERRIDEQAALLDFSNHLLSRPGLTGLMDFLVQEIQKLLQVDACAVVLPCEQPGLLAFKAARGWRSDPVASQLRIPDDQRNGPSRVMDSQEPLVVADITQEGPTTFMPAWIQDEGFRGHVVVPLIVEGQSIGALVINTRRPRLLEEDEIRFLRLMANQGAIAIENARLHLEEIQRQRMAEELEVGRQIQRSMLPLAHPTIPGWELATVYQAAQLVGGDFYDHFWLPGEPERLGIVVADVADKGVPAALFMALSRTVIRTAALNGQGPADALVQANRLILANSQNDLFLSVVYATLDPASGRLTYANGGHNLPLRYRARDGQVQELAAQGIILGAFEEVNLEECSVQVEPGDALLFYTDGVTEALNHDDEMFGKERLIEVLAASASGRAEGIRRAIVEAYNEFTGDTEQSDDVTFLVVKRET